MRKKKSPPSKKTKAERELFKAQIRRFGFTVHEFGEPDEVQAFLDQVTGPERERVFRGAYCDLEHVVMDWLNSTDSATTEKRERILAHRTAPTWEDRFQEMGKEIADLDKPLCLNLYGRASWILALNAVAAFYKARSRPQGRNAHLPSFHAQLLEVCREIRSKSPNDVRQAVEAGARPGLSVLGGPMSGKVTFKLQGERKQWRIAWRTFETWLSKQALQ